ncbi:energy-coupling factor transport system substrate-specific component [Murinocardiopsis flavida]|uniref:Energy-coupling factor transport system substrate-specific component n=1 Tax=Murinocardiopsis flavida TaxID=645275 RepID=A0A2P8DJV4_9ACTN|nr:ECF transporter S component [Murinocardiopsis flavida]PSK97479.1 energy-coupling factor transport system substrate-specific component [Murinocardiopsis flavida]
MNTRSDDPSAQPRSGAARTFRWRTVDIMVAAVLGVAIGVLFFFWGLLWNTVEAAFLFFPPARGVLYGVWLLPGVLGALVIRKPGAGLLTAIAAGTVSMFLGSSWGMQVLLASVLQGAAAELVFGAWRYRRWGIAVAALAGAASGLAAAVTDLVLYYPTWTTPFQAAWTAAVVLSAAVIGGVGGRLLTSALARAGALSAFPSAKG